MANHNPKIGGRTRTSGQGRPKGSLNKATREVREVIAMIAQRNAEAVETWLAEIEDPAKRMDMYLRMLEYHIPKLGRTELSGPNGGAVQVAGQLTFVKPD